MQPLGLTGAQVKAYHAHILGSHDFRIRAEICDTAGRTLKVQETLLDGQVNIQRGDSIRRTASLTFFDPDHRLGLDPNSPFGETLFLDRMVKIVHTTVVPGVGTVTTIPFIGPIATVSRDGETVAVEAQDKAAFAVRGRPPMTAKKNTNAVAAIRKFIAATGETRFRLPTSSKRLPKPYSVGWSEDASPWVVAQKIASQVLGMQLFYSCDGYCTLRRVPGQSAISLSGRHLTSPLKTAYDVTKVVNAVRIEGTKKPKKKQRNSATSNARPEKIATTETLKAREPLSPARLGRNGNPRYLPLLVSGEQYKSSKDAAALARRLLKDQSTTTTGSVTATCLPLMHLDADDLITIRTPDTTVRLRFAEGSIPIGLGGDMSIGSQKRVSAGRRR